MTEVVSGVGHVNAPEQAIHRLPVSEHPCCVCVQRCDDEVVHRFDFFAT